MATDKQLAANRQNAKLSTAQPPPRVNKPHPSTPSKTGLTGQTVLLPTDDVNAYQQHVARFFQEFAPPPCGHNESDDPNYTGTVTQNHQSPEVCPQCARIKELTQSLADTQWRLNRIPALEHGFYALGSLEFAKEFSEVEDPATRAALLQAKTAFAYQRQLSNLSTQEARLRRHFEKDRAELTELLAKRRAQFNKNLLQAFDCYRDAHKTGQSFDPAEIGFEFSTVYLLENNEVIWRRNFVRDGKFYSEKLQDRAA